jgi:hypothetical protein
MWHARLPERVPWGAAAKQKKRWKKPRKKTGTMTKKMKKNGKRTMTMKRPRTMRKEVGFGCRCDLHLPVAALNGATIFGVAPRTIKRSKQESLLKGKKELEEKSNRGTGIQVEAKAQARLEREARV